MPNKITQYEFLKRVKLVHGDNIDFSKFVYDGNAKHGECKCNVCGHIWKVVPMSLFKGHGCPKCAQKVKNSKISLTQDAFIEKAKRIHGNKYDYSKVEYINRKTHVTIICPHHGEFKQTPDSHLNGRGCSKCCDTGIKLTQSEFEERVNKNNTHDIDVSEFKYINSITKGKCKCNVCGHIWYTKPHLIMSNHGCPVCSANERGDKRRYTKDEFVEKFKEVHPEFNYDFSNSIYVNALTKMRVVCDKGHEFITKPNWLMSGHGCPYCNASKLELMVNSALEDNGVVFERQKRDTWLGRLSLDFYLPNEKMAIECQGEQHFVAHRFFGGDEGLKRIKERDEKKRKLCRESGVRLMYLTNKELLHHLNELDEECFCNINELINTIMSSH